LTRISKHYICRCVVVLAILIQVGFTFCCGKLAFASVILEWGESVAFFLIIWQITLLLLAVLGFFRNSAGCDLMVFSGVAVLFFFASVHLGSLVVAPYASETLQFGNLIASGVAVAWNLLLLAVIFDMEKFRGAGG
jgi:hypothetical protein